MNKFKLILKIKKLFNNLFYKIYNKKLNIFKILYNKKNIYGDITIIISNNLEKKFYIKLGNILKKKINKYIYKYEIKNNYLNIFLKKNFYRKIINDFFKKKFNINKYIYNIKNNNKLIIVEYSSPNSNKPLHIGHLRNILIGETISNIYKNIGFKVIKSQIINDRGIHICKAIIAWKLFFKKKKMYKYKKIKGDHFVGKLYFKFEKEFKKEIKKISKKYNFNKKKSIKNSFLFKKINNELIKWEKKNKKSIKIWKKINKLVFKGFKKTYNKLNIKFNETIYESNIYSLGKKKIYESVKKKIFFFDKKKYIYFLYKKKKIILLRNNGTSLYLTQDIGNILYRFKKYKKIYLLIYVVGNEQNFHFKVLFNIIKKLNLSFKNLYHLSYNTVNFLGKKIKSRNGKNIIFIDNFIYIMYKYVKNIFNLKKKKIKKKIINKISIGTIKYQFLKINPSKIINFDFEKSLDLKGNTAIYIQYTYVRIYSIINKNNYNLFLIKKKYNSLFKDNEKDIIINIIIYYDILLKTSKNYDPSILINYIFLFSKKINNFYQKNKIITNNRYKKNIRLNICKLILSILSKTMKILGIPILKKM
ncbi:MAG: arginine--tRNA ligase [Candidatus Shikimatogenerans bostrichidophilus]|nr:MAG: arginine--tRNA ligase [Candidatus Shikimatogenerans bostrichidophilus]